MFCVKIEDLAHHLTYTIKYSRQILTFTYVMPTRHIPFMRKTYTYYYKIKNTFRTDKIIVWIINNDIFDNGRCFRYLSNTLMYLLRQLWILSFQLRFQTKPKFGKWCTLFEWARDYFRYNDHKTYKTNVICWHISNSPIQKQIHWWCDAFILN